MKGVRLELPDPAPTQAAAAAAAAADTTLECMRAGLGSRVPIQLHLMLHAGAGKALLGAGTGDAGRRGAGVRVTRLSSTSTSMGAFPAGELAG
jgi:hypothetical protein